MTRNPSSLTAVPSIKDAIASTIHVWCGLLYCQFKRYPSAVWHFDKAITHLPSSAAYSGLGIAYFKQGLYKKAMAKFIAALDLDPDNDYDLSWLAWAQQLNMKSSRNKLAAESDSEAAQQ